jgi:hypothetical protein
MNSISIFHCFVLLDIDVQIMIPLSFHSFHSFIENPLRTNKTINEEDKWTHINNSQPCESSVFRFPLRDSWVNRSGCCVAWLDNYREAITNVEDLISRYANKLAIDKILHRCVISSRWSGRLPAWPQPCLRCSFLSFCRLLHKPPNAWLCYGPHALHKRKRSLRPILHERSKRRVWNASQNAWQRQPNFQMRKYIYTRVRI